MSIWTELLLFHGHVATPAALALFAPAGARPVAPPTADRAAAPAAPVTAHASHPARPTGSTGEPSCHPLRAVGQLR